MMMMHKLAPERKGAMPDVKIVERYLLDQIDTDGGKAVHHDEQLCRHQYRFGQANSVRQFSHLA